MTESDLSPTRERRPGWRHALGAGLVVALAIAAVPLLGGLGDDTSSRGDGRGTDSDALIAVRAAVGKTVASGSYEQDFTTHTTHVNDVAPSCPPGATCPSASGTSTFESSGHGIINFDPYISRVETNTSLGARTLVVTSTTVWLTGPGLSVTPGTGIPLSSFASSVQGALGRSQGALAMISLASPGGALNLEQAAVAEATPAGTGSVNGVNVTYYDVTIDMTKLADAEGLSDVQRRTIDAALPLLEQGGYTGTTERIGVDDAGYVREITAANHFDDGSTGVRHTVLSNFGCAPRVSPPDQGGEVAAPRPCPPTTPTTAGAPAPAPTSTSTGPPTTTKPAPSTTPAPSPSTTTQTSPPTTIVPPPSSTTTTSP